MTKKDYVAFAKILIDAFARAVDMSELSNLNELESDMIRVFSKDNKRFDTEKFREYVNKRVRLSNRPSSMNPIEFDPSKQRRELREVADEISRNWKNVNYGAVPYLNAMYSLSSVDDHYGMDSGREIVLRFLCNAGTWRGPVAKQIKAELNAMLKGR